MTDTPADRRHLTLSLPTELVDELGRTASERCIGRGLLIEMMLTQGLRKLMPADSFLFGVQLEAIEPATTCATRSGTGWVADDPNGGELGSQSGCPSCTVPGECGGRGATP